MARHGFPSLAVGVLAVLGACGRAGPSMSGATVRDSAGVRIVENVAAAWTESTRWRVTDVPVVRIGRMAGEPAYQFHQIRGIDLHPDGGILVLDGGSMQLRRFDANGGHLWSAGSRGRGPGEFEMPSLIGRDSTNFYLWDRALVRLTVIDTTGTVRQSESHVSESGDSPIGFGRFSDGALLVTFPTTIRPPTPGTLMADTIRLWRFDRTTGERSRLVQLPGPIWMWTGRYQLPVPFTANPLRVVAGTTLVTASGTVPEIRTHDSAGTLIAKFVRLQPPVPVSSEDIQTAIAAWGARRMYGAGLDVWEDWLARMPVPSEQPAYDRLIRSSDGTLWARRFLIVTDTSTVPSWDVISRGGEYLGEIRTPRGLEVMAIGDDALAGVLRDSLDVEHVHVHRIARARN